jgi:tellurite resistance protein TehA-like permease
METESTSTKSLKLTDNSLIFMTEIVKWAKFLAICSFVGLGMMGLAGVAMIILQFERQANGLSTVIMGLFYILMAVIYFFPAVYLYRFATASADAIEKLNEDTLEEGLENLKSLFRFTGILMIIMFSLYAVGIIAVIAAYVIQM